MSMNPQNNGVYKILKDLSLSQTRAEALTGEVLDVYQFDINFRKTTKYSHTEKVTQPILNSYRKEETEQTVLTSNAFSLVQLAIRTPWGEKLYIVVSGEFKNITNIKVGDSITAINTGRQQSIQALSNPDVLDNLAVNYTRNGIPIYDAVVVDDGVTCTGDVHAQIRSQNTKKTFAKTTFKIAIITFFALLGSLFLLPKEVYQICLMFVGYLIESNILNSFLAISLFVLTPVLTISIPLAIWMTKRGDGFVKALNDFISLPIDDILRYRDSVPKGSSNQTEETSDKAFTKPEQANENVETQNKALEKEAPKITDLFTKLIRELGSSRDVSTPSLWMRLRPDYRRGNLTVLKNTSMTTVYRLVEGEVNKSTTNASYTTNEREEVTNHQRNDTKRTMHTAGGRSVITEGSATFEDMNGFQHKPRDGAIVASLGEEGDFFLIGKTASKVKQKGEELSYAFVEYIYNISKNRVHFDDLSSSKIKVKETLFTDAGSVCKEVVKAAIAFGIIINVIIFGTSSVSELRSLPISLFELAIFVFPVTYIILLCLAYLYKHWNITKRDKLLDETTSCLYEKLAKARSIYRSGILQ